MTRILDIGTFIEVRERGLAKYLPAKPRIAIGMEPAVPAMRRGRLPRLRRQIEPRAWTIVLARVGCFGFCAEEPLVNLWAPGRPMVILHRVQSDSVVASSTTWPLGRVTTRTALCRVEDWDHITSHIRFGAGYPELPLWKEVPS